VLLRSLLLRCEPMYPVPGLYPAAGLDRDSEALLLLIDEGVPHARISEPRFKLEKVYLVQVEHEPDEAALDDLRRGIDLGGPRTRPARVERTGEPDWLWPQNLPVRFLESVPTAWIAIRSREGRNRQLRRMTAALGHPTLHLVCTAVGPWRLDGLAPDQ